MDRQTRLLDIDAEPFGPEFLFIGRAFRQVRRYPPRAFPQDLQTIVLVKVCRQPRSRASKGDAIVLEGAMALRAASCKRRTREMIFRAAYKKTKPMTNCPLADAKNLKGDFGDAKGSGSNRSDRSRTDYPLSGIDENDFRFFDSDDFQFVDAGDRRPIARIDADAVDVNAPLGRHKIDVPLWR